MRSLRLILISLLLLGYSYANAQNNNKLSHDPEAFIKEVAAMMSSSKTPTTMQAGEDFVQAWNSGKISAADKRKLMAIAQIMQQKKYRAKPHYESFLGMAAAAVMTKDLAPQEFSKMLDVTQKVTDTYSATALVNYLETCRTLFETDALYASNFNSLLVENGTYTFEYIATARPIVEDNPAPAAPQQELDPFADWDKEPANPVMEISEEAANATATSIAMTPQITLPDIAGAVITFKNVDLILATRFDTTKVAGTSGAYLFSNGQFVGEGGKFDWSVAGLPEVYAQFKKYAFSIKSPAIVAEKVLLHYPQKLDKPAEGIFHFTSKSHKSADDSQYPRFRSYSNEIKVENLSKNIEYKGGFSLAGNHIYSSSINGGNATIKFIHKGKMPLKAISNRFEFNDSLITSDVTYAAIYIDRDSIYHQGVKFIFDKNSNSLKLYKDKSSYRNSSFIDSYHQMEIDCEAVSWDLDSAKIDFYVVNARHQVPAIIESKEFYSGERFQRMQGLYNFHPILTLASYSSKVNTSTFSVYDLAKAYNLSTDQLLPLMGTLMGDGYIDFNDKTGKIKLRDKTFHVFLSQKNMKDYDYMSIKSVSAEESNAILDLDTKELLVNGVDRFYLSNELGVYIEPNQKKLKILKNRNLMFDGKINAGKFLSYGQNFEFDYTNFKVNLERIDSIIVTIESDKQDRKKGNSTLKTKLENRFEVTSGVLYINEPKNKSGKKPYPQFPIFDVASPAYIYFDTKEIFNKAYTEQVYFAIPPFKVDSMASSSLTAVIFNGSFHSDNIFPVLKEKLTVQPDRTLGFVHETPSEGYKLYGGAGTFYGSISLDSKGIRGKGEIKYLTASIVSDDFIFYQDSVIAAGKTVIVKEGVYQNIKIPDAVVSNYQMKWFPKKDSLLIFNSPKEPIQLYSKTVDLDGFINLTAKGVAGEGLIKTRGAQVYSKEFQFEPNKFAGKHADFEVKSDNPLKPALVSRDIRFNFNLKEGYADFAPEIEGVASIEFPYAQYKTSISKAVWDLDKKLVTMSTQKESDLSNSYFYSTHPDQDSLVFNARNAVYDITQLSLNITGVPYIKAADAKIIPDSNRVTILEKANMQPLTNAVIIVDTINAYHTLINANVNIKSRKEYLGDALYQYITVKKDTILLRFDNFSFVKEESKRRKGEEVIRTVSGGTIDEAKPLKIADGVLYRGKVTMYANKKTLDFDGEVKLDIKNKALASSWLRYENRSDNPEFSLNLTDAKTTEGVPLVSGLHIENGSGKLYYTFVSEKRISSDQDVFLADGQLSVNSDNKTFRLGNPAKINGKSYEGNIFSYNDSLSIISYEGKLNLVNSDKNFSFQVTGAGTGRLDTNTYTFNTMMAIDLGLPPQAMDIMGKDLAERITAIGSVSEANDDKVTLLYKLADMIGNKAAEDYGKMTEKEYVSLSRMSPKLAKGLVLSDVNLKWSDKHNAWYSVGRLGLSNINKQDVNAKVDGFVEVRKTYSGDLITVYIEASPNTWYFFTYDDQKRMAALSSNQEFNRVVAGKSKSKRAKPGEYFFALADIMERAVAVKSFYKAYFDREVVPSTAQAQTEAPAEESGTEQAKGKASKKAKGKGKAVEEEKQDKPAEAQKEQPKPEPKKQEEEDADGF